MTRSYIPVHLILVLLIRVYEVRRKISFHSHQPRTDKDTTFPDSIDSTRRLVLNIVVGSRTEKSQNV